MSPLLHQNHDPNQEQENKSTARQVVEQKAKKATKKAVKKLMKKAAKLAIKAVKTAIVALFKTLMAFLASLGLPAILVIGGVIAVCILVMFVSTFFFGGGIDLDEEGQEIYDFMVQELDKTIDPRKPEQLEFRLPEQLLAAVIQLDVMYKEHESKEDQKKLIAKMAKALAPKFDYGEYNEYYETFKRICNKNGCYNTPLVQIDNYVDKIDYVNAWDGETYFDYVGRMTEWTAKTPSGTTVPVNTNSKGEIVSYSDQYTETIYKRQKVFDLASKNKVPNYYTFDSILNQYGFSTQDKKIVEALYEFSGGTMYYTEWLEGGKAFTDGFVGFDGTVVPGSNVPAEFMQYYLGAEAKYGVPWYYLASIHFIETTFSTNVKTSGKGAIGHMQVRP